MDRLMEKELGAPPVGGGGGGGGAALPPLPPPRVLQEVEERERRFAASLSAGAPLPLPAAPAAAPAAPRAPADAASAADAAFLADMVSAGLDPSTAPAELPPLPPPPPRAPWKHGPPGGSARRPPAAPHSSAQARSNEILTQLFPPPLASGLDDAFKRASSVASGVADTLGAVARGAEASFQRRASTAVAVAGAGGGGRGGEGAAAAAAAAAGGGGAAAAAGSGSAAAAAASAAWAGLGRLLGGAPPAAAPQPPSAPAPGAAPPQPDTETDAAIFRSLRAAWAGAVGGGGGGGGAGGRQGVGGASLLPTASAPRRGLNPATLGGGGGGGGGAAPLCSALAMRVEEACGPVTTALCCVLVPLSLVVRACGGGAAAVAACAGCGSASGALLRLTARATPRALFALLLLCFFAWMAWHWGIMGEGGALEWGVPSNDLERPAGAVGGAVATFAPPPPAPT
jgi:hypothetical protein